MPSGAVSAGELAASSTRFFPSRWRRLLGVAAVLGLLLAAVGIGLSVSSVTTGAWTSERWSTVLSTAGVLLASASAFRSARRNGVTVSHDGVRLEPGGRWTWDEIERIDVVEEEYVRGAPHHVVLGIRGGERVRLGPITGREDLVREIRVRLRPRPS